ncbi:MAG: transglutaminase family protein [Verrucomicrobiota bacterium]|nr:transglutaminase family protein [Verrucomicrobiota bacterium]
MNRYKIKHVTRIEYSAPVSYSQQCARLQPMSRMDQQLLHYSLTIFPEPSSQGEWIDFHGNRLNYFTLSERHNLLIVDSTSEVTVSRIAGILPSVSLRELREAFKQLNGPARMEGENSIYASPLVTEHRLWSDLSTKLFGPETTAIAAIDLFFNWLHDEFVFDSKATTTDTPLLEFYEKRRGVCQDFSHLTLAILRAAGIPARYISGYLLTEPAPGQPRQLGVDASHAWVQLYFAGTGWVGIDPTNHCLTDSRYIKVAIGRDYSDVSPLRGSVIGGGTQTVAVGVTVERCPGNSTP